MSIENNQTSINKDTTENIVEEMEACRIRYEHEKKEIEKTTRYWTKETVVPAIVISLIIVLLCSVSPKASLIALTLQTVSTFLFNITIVLGFTMFCLKKIRKFGELDLDIPKELSLEERLQKLDENMKKSSKKSALAMTTLLLAFIIILFGISPFVINQFIKGTNLFVIITFAIATWACMTPAIGELIKHNRERKAYKKYDTHFKLAKEKLFSQGI